MNQFILKKKIPLKTQLSVVGAFSILVIAGLLMANQNKQQPIDADEYSLNDGDNKGEYELQLTDWHGKPAIDYYVVLESLTAARQLDQTVTETISDLTDGSGKAKFYHLKPGPYRVVTYNAARKVVRPSDADLILAIAAGEKKSEKIEGIPYPPNTPPALAIVEPTGSQTVAQAGPYKIRYNLTDLEDEPRTRIDWYYDTDNKDYNGTKFNGACANKNNPVGVQTTCDWVTSAVAPGTYYIYGVATDGIDISRAYSPGTVTIQAAAPTFSITRPSANNETVTQGQTFAAGYSLTDSYDTKASFFYDSDTNPGAETAIVGPTCLNAPKGTGKTCSFNTSTVGAGIYYLKMQAIRPGQAPFTIYSAKTLTVNPQTPTSLKVVNGKGKSVDLTWNFSAPYGTYTFEVYRSESSNGSYTSVGTKTQEFGSGKPTAVSATDSNNIQNKKTYYYKVRAFNQTSLWKVYSAYTGTVSLKTK